LPFKSRQAKIPLNSQKQQGLSAARGALAGQVVLEIILKALAAIPEAQVFIATHSPLVVQEEGVDVLLCFSRDDQGVHTVAGNKHPALQDWKGVPDLATIFSSRVLG
jgi:predicted ATP-dependent endonuclease of OLD family